MGMVWQLTLYSWAFMPVLRRKMTMLLDVIWADWAVEQIDRIRGGSKSRVYQGQYSQLGYHDSYHSMADVLLGRGAWTNGKHEHTNSGYVYCLAMSRYRLPIVVAKIAINRPTQPYVSISRRLAKMTGIEKLPDYQPYSNWYVLDPEDTRAVRYTYCTSDYIMGTWWVDPALGVASVVNCTSDEGMLSVRFRDADDQPAELKFDPKQKVLPRVNGTTINLNPKKVYDCPYMSSDFGSGIVTMGQDEDVYIWNMHDNSIRKLAVETR
jgi:hypothetical protein